MSLISYEPFRQLSNMRKELDHLFRWPNLFNHDPSFIGNLRIDLQETETEVIATIDLPGLKNKDDVQIEVQHNVLKISGKIEDKHENKEDHFLQRERFVGNFYRSITLPTAVSQEGIQASYRHGVLEVKMPKMKSEDKRKIDVQFH